VAARALAFQFFFDYGEFMVSVMEKDPIPVLNIRTILAA
jgi:hypothetical protein